MIARRLAKQPRRREPRGDSQLIRGLDPAIEALRDIQRLKALRLSASNAATRLEAVINRLRQEGETSNLPFLISLAEALEDALIAASE